MAYNFGKVHSEFLITEKDSILSSIGLSILGWDSNQHTLQGKPLKSPILGHRNYE